MNTDRISYTSKAGLTLWKPVVSSSNLYNLDGGWCLTCGEHVDGVEPDAHRYTCECCGKPHVYGYEELALKNLLVVEE